MKKQQSKEREPKCKQKKNKLNIERDEIKKINLKNH
jgi:hypothetical protein